MTGIMIAVAVVCVGVVLFAVLYFTGCFSKKKENKENLNLPNLGSRTKGIETKNKRRQGSEEKEDIVLPNICQIWDRWTTLDRDLHVPEEKNNRLGAAWMGNVCPARSLYQKINQVDCWCITPENQRLQTRELCANYISNDHVADAVPPTVPITHPLAAFDRWIELKKPLGIGAGTRQGTAWEGSVCPRGACYQLLANKESWCIPKEAVQQATQAAGEVSISV